MCIGEDADVQVDPSSCQVPVSKNQWLRLGRPKIISIERRVEGLTNLDMKVLQVRVPAHREVDEGEQLRNLGMLIKCLAQNHDD